MSLAKIEQKLQKEVDRNIGLRHFRPHRVIGGHASFDVILVHEQSAKNGCEINIFSDK